MKVWEVEAAHLADQRVVADDDGLAVAPGCQSKSGADGSLAHPHLVREPPALDPLAVHDVVARAALGECLHPFHCHAVLNVEHEGERLALVGAQRHPRSEALGLGVLDGVDLLDRLEQLLARPAVLAA